MLKNTIYQKTARLIWLFFMALYKPRKYKNSILSLVSFNLQVRDILERECRYKYNTIACLYAHMRHINPTNSVITGCNNISNWN